jgi:hypothetical protein
MRLYYIESIFFLLRVDKEEAQHEQSYIQDIECLSIVILALTRGLVLPHSLTRLGQV